MGDYEWEGNRDISKNRRRIRFRRRIEVRGYRGIR
jgi:hypothetical protein